MNAPNLPFRIGNVAVTAITDTIVKGDGDTCVLDNDACTGAGNAFRLGDRVIVLEMRRMGGDEVFYRRTHSACYSVMMKNTYEG